MELRGGEQAGTHMHPLLVDEILPVAIAVLIAGL
jgi:hypothetical protein